MNSILVAALCGIAFTGGALVTISLYGWANRSGGKQKRVIELQERLVDQGDKLIAQRKVQLMILEDIRDALKGGAK